LSFFIFSFKSTESSKSHKQRVQVAEDASDSAPEEVTAKSTRKQFAQQEERATFRSSSSRIATRSRRQTATS
jgi:hypothetical protein